MNYKTFLGTDYQRIKRWCASQKPPVSIRHAIRVAINTLINLNGAAK